MHTESARLRLALDALKGRDLAEKAEKVLEEIRVAQLIAALAPYTCTAQAEKLDKRAAIKRPLPKPIVTRQRKTHHWGPLHERYQPRR